MNSERALYLMQDNTQSNTNIICSNKTQLKIELISNIILSFVAKKGTSYGKISQNMSFL